MKVFQTKLKFLSVLMQVLLYWFLQEKNLVSLNFCYLFYFCCIIILVCFITTRCRQIATSWFFLFV